MRRRGHNRPLYAVLFYTKWPGFARAAVVEIFQVNRYFAKRVPPRSFLFVPVRTSRLLPVLYKICTQEMCTRVHVPTYTIVYLPQWDMDSDTLLRPIIASHGWCLLART